MKKHLIAAAVAAAVAAPVMAQNVSVYGVLDTAIQRHDSGSANVVRAADGVLATSRLGFRGTEDLGGGLKAIFNLEARLNPSTGANGASLFNRGAWVGLSGSFGEIRLGQGDTTTNQDIDSKVSQAGNLGLRASIATFNGELGGDINNVVRYISPRMNGFTVELGYAANASSAVANASTQTKDFYAQYEQGPLGVYVGKAQLNATTSANEQDSTAIGAKYNFGSFSLGAVYTKADVNAAGDLKSTMVSGAIPLGNGLTLHGVYASAEIENSTGNKGDGFTLAITKAMSKRTTLYAAYTNTDSKTNGSFSMVGVTAPATNGADPSAMTFGISHSF